MRGFRSEVTASLLNRHGWNLEFEFWGLGFGVWGLGFGV